MRDYAADIAYRTRQVEKGLRQLSVWVPSDLQVLLVELAGIARNLPVQGEGQSVGLNTLIIDVHQLLKEYRPSVSMSVDPNPQRRPKAAKRKQSLQSAQTEAQTADASLEKTTSD